MRGRMKLNFDPGWKSGDPMTGTHNTVQFLFDFGSPNAYLCHKVIPEIETRTGARFEYVPVLLGGLFKLANNRSPIEAFADIPNKMAYERLEMQRFIQRHAINRFKFNPHFPVNTLHLMRGAVAAQQLDCVAPYVDAMFAAMWEHGLKMDDPAVIGGALAQSGLDAERLMQTAQTAEVKARLMSNTQVAHDRGAFGSPTFFVGDAMYFGKDRLREVEAALAAA
jgi:2-hydroxychromene-2-carboxylate isomerase